MFVEAHVRGNSRRKEEEEKDGGIDVVEGRSVHLGKTVCGGCVGDRHGHMHACMTE